MYEVLCNYCEAVGLPSPGKMQYTCREVISGLWIPFCEKTDTETQAVLHILRQSVQERGAQREEAQSASSMAGWFADPDPIVVDDSPEKRAQSSGSLSLIHI